MTRAAAAPPPVFAPVGEARRIEVLDVLRGFALLGIFLMNIEWFSRPLQQMGFGIDPAARGLDHAAAWLVYVFVQGKFWVLFALLFGMGFEVMSSRAGNDAVFRRVYRRRCLALLAFGLLHGVLLWSGDILHAYAIAGLVLLAMRVVDRPARLLLGVVLYASISALALLSGALISLLPADAGDAMADPDFAQAITQAAQVYAHGSYLEVTAQRARDFGSLALQGAVSILPMALGVFLVGSWLVRSGRMQDVHAQRAWFVRLLGWTLPPGVLLAVLSLRVGVQFEDLRQMGPMLLATGLMLLASLPLALSWLALVVLGMGMPGLSRLLSWLAPAGRMALTHYLLQSLVASTLFFGYGFGLWGQVGRAGQVGIVLLVFALQVLASHWWLSRHRHGPMEWLWRWISYGARPQMRRG